MSPQLLQRWKEPPRLSGWSFQTGVDNPPAFPDTHNVQLMRQLTQLVLLAMTPALAEPRSAHHPSGERATAGQLWHRPIHLTKNGVKNLAILLPTNHACKLRHLSGRKGYRTRPPQRRLSTPRWLTQGCRTQLLHIQLEACYSVNKNRAGRPYQVRHNVTSHQSSPVALFKCRRQPSRKKGWRKMFFLW